MAEKKLYKTKDGAMVGGVLKGISEVYELDASLVRLAFLALILLGVGSPILVYLIVYIVLPDKKEVISKNLGKDYTIDNDEYKY